MDDKNLGADGVTSDSVEEWLEEISEAEGLSREETLEDLISSYWRLEEIFHLLQDTDIDLDRSPKSVGNHEVVRKSDLDRLRNRVNLLADEIQEREAEATSIVELQRTVSDVDGRLDAFERQFSDVSEELSALPDEPLADRDDLADRLTTLEKRMNRVESSVSGVDDRIGNVAASAVTEERFEAYAKESESIHESLRGKQQSLKELVRTEFGNIRTILTHLLESSSGGDERLHRITRDIEDDFREHLAEESTLASLLRVANREGIRTAACSHCDETVDLALLEDTACPNCEELFESIGTRPRYWGLSRRHVLTLADGQDED